MGKAVMAPRQGGSEAARKGDAEEEAEVRRVLLESLREERQAQGGYEAQSGGDAATSASAGKGDGRTKGRARARQGKGKTSEAARRAVGAGLSKRQAQQLPRGSMFPR